ncbi:type II toxin-antitoxin system PemK/MazF family toxin [Suttonella indologenes]|uniref:mRNA interferase PemK n=1 Tax=Suttonella indologenes TaxID=13276 RepID=A0A380MJF0_9GAMM|nr:type II toxin-antitoxin system PemK/MazF family toxin [Suttonella indologenes]SUO91978.1 mRNA interferase PemK [Suttonella indologenes]
MTYIPEKGDIIHLQFDPASGTEMKGRHYALALSPKVFNQATGLAYVCPISQGMAGGARSLGMLSTLQGSGTHTQGNVHCHQLKSIDWRIRQAVFKEKVPNMVIEDVMARLQAILFDEY